MESQAPRDRTDKRFIALHNKATKLYPPDTANARENPSQHDKLRTKPGKSTLPGPPMCCFPAFRIQCFFDIRVQRGAALSGKVVIQSSVGFAREISRVIREPLFIAAVQPHGVQGIQRPAIGDAPWQVGVGDKWPTERNQIGHA